ncbi:hypothetical protein HYW75_00840 [Candidatus Pacearchaeota archaeon]|nr:hypothetical protein [Candidatus Pacearchaeota archaeon]
MKKINIISLVFGILGIIVLIFGWLTIFGEGSGLMVIGFGFPFLIIGIIIWLVGLLIKRE